MALLGLDKYLLLFLRSEQAGKNLLEIVSSIMRAGMYMYNSIVGFYCLVLPYFIQSKTKNAIHRYHTYLLTTHVKTQKSLPSTIVGTPLQTY